MKNMNYQIRLVIDKKKCIYDDIIVVNSSNYKCSVDESNEIKIIQRTSNRNEFIEDVQFYPMRLCKKGFNAYFVSAYIKTMFYSNIYRNSAIKVLINFINSKNINLSTYMPVILIKLRTPKHQYIDYCWNERISRMLMERQEIDHAMLRLSTLGGAFSSLGDRFDHCAKVAGKISVKQFKLSIKLGDSQLVARCKLYLALSLLQQGYFNASQYMIKDIYKFAVNEKDTRLENMCQGVWAKLKYFYNQRKKKVKQ